jgi:hypothetical protein
MLGLAGANVRERRTAASGPERWSGIVEHVHQDTQQRYVVLRLDTPSDGAALVGTYEKGADTKVNVCRYFYGDDAEARAAESETLWRDWLTRSFGTEGAAQQAATTGG